MIVVFHGKDENSCCGYIDGRASKAARHGVPFYISKINGESLIKKNPRFTEFKEYNKLLDIDASIKNRKKVVIMTNSHIGDNLMSIPSVLKYLKVNCGTDVIIVTEEKHRCIWEGYKRIDFMDIQTQYPNFRRSSRPFVITIRDNESKHPLDKRRNRCLNIADYCDKIPLTIAECVNVFNWEQFPCPELNGVVNKVGIQLRSQDINRTWDWNLEKPKEVCEQLVKKGYTPILFDASKLNLNWKGCIDLTGCFNERQYINAISHCDSVLVCGDTGAEHIAGNLNIPFLAIFTKGYRPESRLSHYPENNYDSIYVKDIKNLTSTAVFNRFIKLLNENKKENNE